VYLNEKNADRREDGPEAGDSAEKERFWGRFRMTKSKRIFVFVKNYEEFSLRRF
jgi:hypothetical protein